MSVRRKLFALAAVAAVAVPSVSQAAQPSADPQVIVFNGEGNRLNAYDHASGEKRTVIWSASDPRRKNDKREHRDINGQICFTEHDGQTYFIAGEDTAQNGEEGDPGWGWFQLKGDELGNLYSRQRGKLVPTYGNQTDNPENYGCGFLDDGRLVTTDVGDQLPFSGANGQLILWFQDADGGFDEGFTINANGIPQASALTYCKVDDAIATAGGVWIDHGDPADATDDVVYVANNRPAQAPTDEWGVWRYEGIGSVTGCADSDAPLIEDPNSGVTKELFIRAGATGFTPSAIADSGNGTLFVSSVFDGNVGEYDQETGAFLRHVAGTPGGPVPVSAPLAQPLGLAQTGPGTPFGVGVTPDGSLYYADIGVVGGGPERPGRLMRVTFDDAGTPSFAEVVDTGLAFPDGIGVLVLR
jgi:hypothetical protein